MGVGVGVPLFSGVVGNGTKEGWEGKKSTATASQGAGAGAGAGASAGANKSVAKKQPQLFAGRGFAVGHKVHVEGGHDDLASPSHTVNNQNQAPLPLPARLRTRRRSYNDMHSLIRADVIAQFPVKDIRKARKTRRHSVAQDRMCVG